MHPDSRESPIPGVPLEIRTLAQWRAMRGFTQEQLAQIAGLSWSTLASIEGGKHEPTLSTAAKLAALLGLNVGQIKWPLNDALAPYNSRTTAKRKRQQEMFRKHNAEAIFDPTELTKAPPQVQIEMAALVFKLLHEPSSGDEARGEFRSSLQELGLNNVFINAALSFTEQVTIMWSDRCRSGVSSRLHSTLDCMESNVCEDKLTSSLE